mgnify:CR=1 FL=1
MAYFTTLYSGSSGNCALIRSEDKYLLIDMGKSCRTTLTALKSLGLAASSSRTSTPTTSRDWIPF